MSEQLDTHYPNSLCPQAAVEPIVTKGQLPEKKVTSILASVDGPARPRARYPRSRKNKLKACGKRLYTPTGDVFVDWELPLWERYECGLRVCPRCEARRMKDFMQNAQHHAQQAIQNGAECYWVTLTIPKGDMKPGEAMQALREALRLVSKHKKFAGLGDDLLGWIRVGEMGKQLSPHVHMLVFVRPGTVRVKDRVKQGWETALAKVLGWIVRPDRLFNSVKRIPNHDAASFKLKYMSKGDPYRSYTDKQKQAWEVATKGWSNLKTSQNWSLQRSSMVRDLVTMRTPHGTDAQHPAGRQSLQNRLHGQSFPESFTTQE